MLSLIYTAPDYIITFVSVIVITRVSETIGIYWRRSQRDPTAPRQIAGHSFVLVKHHILHIVEGRGVADDPFWGQRATTTFMPSAEAASQAAV